MSSSHLKFPTWEEVLSGWIEKYRLRIELPESLFEDAYFLCKALGSKNTTFTFSAQEQDVDDLGASPQIPAVLIQEILEKRSLEANQFLTLSHSDLDILWTDDRMADILAVSKEDFNEGALCDWNKSPILYHPMDALHVLRYAMLKELICELKGIMLPDQDYYFNLRFRMMTIQGRGTEGMSPTFKLIDKRRSAINYRSDDQDTLRFYLNLWTVSNDYEKHKAVEPSIEIMSDPERTRFLNGLLFILNAKYLGFNPKDLIVINYNNLYDGPEESRASLNRALRHHHDHALEFEVKPFTDTSYYLNKKLTASLEKNSLDKIYKSSFYVRLNRLSKARRLGLTPLARELRELILSKVYWE